MRPSGNQIATRALLVFGISKTMKIKILDHGKGYPLYVEEILRTWGVTHRQRIEATSLEAANIDSAPVWIIPAGMETLDETVVTAFDTYVERGGILITFLPQGVLATLAGLEFEGIRESHLRLRVTGFRASGLAGESLPLIGTSYRYRLAAPLEELAYIYDPQKLDGVTGEHAGITCRHVGKGKVLAIAFDLPQAVWMLRQGEPARAGYIPPIQDRSFSHEKPSNLACDIGPRDSGWMPFADLLARLLVDLLQWVCPAPLPLLWHLPGKARAIMLYSGDEDTAPVEATQQELESVSKWGGRMNLYIIPNATYTTPEEVRRYQEHHDVGPHPDLGAVKFDRPEARAEEYRRQIEQFNATFQVKARSIRNHVAMWSGYLDLVRVQEACGIRMDGNYFSGICSERDAAPYNPFGGAMPMRFCEPTGDLINVFQQHTQLADDIMLAPRFYSYRFSDAMFEAYLERVLDEANERFHMPVSVNFHPGNWVEFSEAGGISLLSLARDRGIPVWSFDQWLTFWEERDAVHGKQWSWDQEQLVYELNTSSPAKERTEMLSVALPWQFRGRQLCRARCNEQEVKLQQVQYFGNKIALIPLNGNEYPLTLKVNYTKK